MKKMMAVFVLLLCMGCGKTKGDACDGGGVIGDDGSSCMTCSQGSPSFTGGAGCSDPNNGVYCCVGTTSNPGNGTVMGCTPPTGCYPPVSWYGGGFCYSTSNACHTGGNSTCRQCY